MTQLEAHFLGKDVKRVVLLCCFLMVLAACNDLDAEEQNASEVEPTQEALVAVPATWTAVPVVLEETAEPTELPPPTNTPLPTSTPVTPSATPEPTDTAEPTDTPEPTATDTPEPTETSPPPTDTPPPAPTSPPQPTAPPGPTAPPPPAVEPTVPPEPILGVNLLPNPSFEEGHYLQNGVPELQLPNKWRVEWDEGATGVGNASWDVYVRPEVRVLSTAFLPQHEHALYIYNGQHTVKAFKGHGAVSLRLLTDVTLEPGTYVIEAKMFADIVEQWANNEKQWAGDPNSAQFHFIVGNGGTVWQSQRFGQINVHNWTFDVNETQTMTVGIALRGIYAIANNGWFIDDLSIRRVE